ncbi:MAG: inositol-3-phosphate synthase [Syntrophorhabdaceae bacterium]|nr:inositol-3-phosphate synthase [Syntrophorhabdaceae bacterium]MDD4196136.1 inositol-3-phosphate synthase [Syntrophorhabdaceae bacterium]HOC46661.1 inositol-3-phosphate synthase [Syntrophorhabdaceae bacterium]
MRDIGVMLVGVLGHLSLVILTGASLLKKGLYPVTGMVTARDEFNALGLIDPGKLVFGGWDIRFGSPEEKARQYLVDTLLIDAGHFRAVADDLKAVERHIFAGTYMNCGKTIGALADTQGCMSQIAARDIFERLRGDIRDFRSRADVDNVIVVNLGSTEPPLPVSEEHHFSPDAVLRCVNDDRQEFLRAGTLYSMAAIQENCAYINFTPSSSALLPGIVRLAENMRVPVMGNDGKTGETLVKSALSSMFRSRNLEVLSWEGFNILGNMDGKVLDDQENRQSKIESKDALLPSILGYTPHTHVHIGYVPSLGDQKTAWDFIHFKGFLEAKMSLQFIWQGFDSILAAPLVLDIVRLVEFALRSGEYGLMPHLASFFKAPLGVHEHRLHEQFRILSNYVSARTDRGPV